MNSTKREGPSEEGPVEDGTSSRKKLGGGGSAAWGGYSIALMMAMRSIVPLMRSTGPGGRHVAVLLVLAALPVTVGVQAYRRKAEQKESAARAARAKARLGGGRSRSAEEPDEVA
jgi:hypothetical protein